MPAQHRVPVILTRAKAQAERFAQDLPKGTYAVISPLLDIAFLPLDAPPMASETLLFSSENGVASLVAARGGHPAQKALCVGDRTADVAATAGFAAQSARGTAEDLIALALRSDGPFVLVRGVHTRGDVAETLRAQGRTCRELVLYRQEAKELSTEALSLLAGAQPVLVPLFSPRTADLFYNACPESACAHLLCLSRNVADAVAEGHYGSLEISSAPSASSLQTALCGRLRAIHLETGGASG